MIHNRLKEILKLLALQKYDEIYLGDFKKKITPVEISRAIEQYGGSLTMPPDKELKQVEIYDVTEGEKFIDFDLWVNSEKSDLTLSCTFYLIERTCKYSIENIHVL